MPAFAGMTLYPIVIPAKAGIRITSGVFMEPCTKGFCGSPDELSFRVKTVMTDDSKLITDKLHRRIFPSVSIKGGNNVIFDLHARLYHLDHRTGNRSVPAPRAGRVDSGRRSLSDWRGDHLWREDDPAKRSAVPVTYMEKFVVSPSGVPR
jgi:hypothetical protein